MFRTVLLASLILTSVAALATPPPVYLRSDEQLIINGQAFRRGFFTARFDLGDRFESKLDANNEYRLHRVWGAWGGALIWGSIATLVSYSIIASNNNSYDAETAFWLFWFPEFFLGAISMGQSHRHLLKAINIYNGIPHDQAGLSRDMRFVSRASSFAPSVGLKFEF